MAENKTRFPSYKGKPLVRSGDLLYYGDMRDNYVVRIQIKSKKKFTPADDKTEDGKPLKVFDEDGYCVGDYLVDMLVNDSLIVELKAAKSLAPEHFAQILNYLKITHNSVGLLVNFGSYKFERRTITA